MSRLDRYPARVDSSRCLLGHQTFSTKSANGISPSLRSRHRPSRTSCSSRCAARNAARRDGKVPADRYLPSRPWYIPVKETEPLFSRRNA